MLNRLLTVLSEEQLISMLPVGSDDFIKQVSGTSDFQRESVAQAVAISSASKFVSDSEYRALLIDALPPAEFLEVFGTLFDKTDSTSIDVTPSHYVEVKKWAGLQENHLELSRRLEVDKEYIASVDQPSSIESIVRVSPAYSLYPYQKRISDDVLEHLKEEQRVLVHLPTGSGKTRTAMNIVVEHLRQSEDHLVLWLADREELCQQAYEEFQKAWGSCGVRNCTAYGFYSSSDQSLGGIDSGFIVAGLHTLLSLRKRDSRQLELLYHQLRNSVTLVVFDEAHKAVAEMYQAVTEDFVKNENFSAKLIGLTATPGRVFGDVYSEENAKLSQFFDNNKMTMHVDGYLSPIDYLVEKKYLAKANFKSLNYLYADVMGFSLREESKTETLKLLSESEERNKTLLKVIQEEVSNGKQVIVFACSVKHSQLLSVALNCLGITAASIDSKSDTPETRRLKVAQYKSGDISVLTNFNVLTAGFDAPNTSVSVIAKPTNSLVEYLQMAGRAMRGTHSGGHDSCNIYTVNDDLPEFQSLAIAFEHWDKMWSDSPAIKSEDNIQGEEK